MTVTLTKYPTALLNKVGTYVCQAIIYIQQKQPELLLDKYRSISWRDNTNQSRLKAKLIEATNQIQDWESLINRVEEFIQTLLVTDSTNTPVLIKVKEKIRQLNPDNLDSNVSHPQQDVSAPESNPKTVKTNTPPTDLQDSENKKDPNIDSQKQDLPATTDLKKAESQQQANSTTAEASNIEGIAVLLLDAENVQITSETEQFLTTVCNNPIKIKIAFANWQNMGEKDIELHNRGYDLIHVPRCDDNTNEKIIAFGAVINEYYPKVKEVLVCSSDRVMMNLREQLQEKGLSVYQVSQENSNVTILNGKTNQTQTHTILPSLEQLLAQIKDIIEQQEIQTSNQWIKLSIICKLFKEKYSFGINKVVSHHLPGKNIKDIFANKAEFVIHQIAEHPELYVTLFKMPIQ